MPTTTSDWDKAPLGYFFPVLGFVGAFVVLTQQTEGSLITTAILLAIGAVYWLFFGGRFSLSSGVTDLSSQDL